jgi:geranylgeranyl diphosphate synthase type I
MTPARPVVEQEPLATAPRSSQEVLAWGRATLEPALRAAVDELPEAVRRVVEFHFGWRDEHGAPVSLDNGKAIRPTIVLLTAEASGGDRAAALPAAVAVELVHNFSLLHDDVMDGDVLRRHRTTAWAAFGIGPAILAGDALLTLAFDTLAATGGPRGQRAVHILSAAVQALVDGQIADVAFESREDVALQECMDMARGKTAALLGCSCALGELSASGDEGRIERMRSFGERLGLAFQLIDDILGIWGDPARTGKAIHSDISARKKSLPVVAALTSDTPAARELATLYFGSEPLTQSDVATAAALVDASGGRAWTEAEAAAQLAAALEDLHAVGARGRAAAELESLALLVTTRDR